MAKDATWYQGGAGPGVNIRVIVKNPDDVGSFANARIWSETTMVDVRVSEVPGLAQGDRIEIDGAAHIVQGEPQRDTERMIWTAELVPE